VIGLKGVPQSNEGKEALAAMESRASRAEKEVGTILGEAVAKAQIVHAGGTVVGGTNLADALKNAALNSLARLYPQFGDADHPGWEKVVDRARRKNPDAVSAVDHQGPPENHPVCKAVLAYLGPGRRGADIRAHFGGSPFGWPQDAIDGALMVL